jgi:hypothetical protein
VKSIVFWNVTVCSDINLPTFHRNALPQTSRSKFERNKEMISLLFLLVVCLYTQLTLQP